MLGILDPNISQLCKMIGPLQRQRFEGFEQGKALQFVCWRYYWYSPNRIVILQRLIIHTRWLVVSTAMPTLGYTREHVVRISHESIPVHGSHGQLVILRQATSHWFI